MTVPDSPENKCPTVECPDCGGMGSGEGGFRGGKKWKAICPGCGGSGRINTSAEEARNQGDFLGDDLSGVHTCHAGCPCHGSPVDSGTGTRASVPSSPHETGLTAEQKARIEGLDSFGFVEWGDSDEAYLEALTNSGAGSRSDSEGEGLAARIEELELSLKQADEELARVTRAAVKGPDGYDYHWCPGVGWCPGCPPSAVPKEEA